MKFFRRHGADLDARVAEARRRASEAAGQARLSEARHEAVVEQVIRPLRRAAERNMFADMIRASLTEGRGHG